jgi:DNA-binding beta-propeller fold protein YncE
VLDTATNTVVAEVQIDVSMDVAFSPDGKLAYVTNFEGASVVDTSTKTIRTAIPVSEGADATIGGASQSTLMGKAHT